MNSPHNFIALLFCALAAFTLTADAQLIISININESQGRRPIAPTDLAGAPGVRVNNWNDVRNGSELVLGADLVYNNGTSVGAPFSITLDLVNTAIATSSLINDAQMFAGKSDLTNGAPTATVTLTNIPFAQYELYIYTNGGNNNRGGSISLAGGTTYYNRGNLTPTDTGTNYTQITTTTYDVENASEVGIGNYVLYGDLSGTSQTFSLTALEMLDSVNFRQGFQGFQIVEIIPEPSTGAMLLGASALLFLRGRRRS